ncbi:MAG: hypothetical protein KA960_04970, partial [Nitrospira sp.]|nr:hypothetical protein [Nitrospira sp.]
MGNVIKKSLVGIVIGGILFGATNALGFPFVFQVLFFGYAMLGAVVFIILDLPPLKPISGVKAAGALVVFYAILSVAYIAGGAVWPQFDPEDEKGKIDKILKPKREHYEAGKVEVLLQRAKALDEKAKELTARLQALGAAQAPADQKAGGE